MGTPLAGGIRSPGTPTPTMKDVDEKDAVMIMVPRFACVHGPNVIVPAPIVG